MRLLRSRNWLLLASILWLSACQGAPLPHVQQSPRPTAPAPAADPQRCDRLAKRGFTPCPPTPDRLQLPPTTIRNATNGAVSGTTAQQWGRAFQLTEAYYRWAVTAGSRSALTSGNLADAVASENLFGPDLQDLDTATEQGGQLVDQSPHLAGVQLVTVPSDLQNKIRGQGLASTPYAFAVTLAGPARRDVLHSNGHRTNIWTVPAGDTQSLLIWGQARRDPDLGEIWFESGLYGCQSVRDVCQL